MSSSAHQHARDQRLLFETLIAWRLLPEDVREQALDVLTALLLESVKHQIIAQQKPEIETHDDSDND
jgi:hypothetical protein